MWCERVMVVWHLLFLGTVSAGARRTKEKSKSKGHQKGGSGGGSSRSDTTAKDRTRVQCIKPVKLTCHYIKRAMPSRHIITLTIPFQMTEFPQLTQFLQQFVCIINKSFMCHSCDFYSFLREFNLIAKAPHYALVSQDAVHYSQYRLNLQIRV